MNVFKKAFCRVYQAAFHAALPVLPYREPVRLDSIEKVPSVLENLGKRSVLMITDKSLRGAGVTASLEALMRKSPVSFTVYDSVRPNPTVDNVNEALEIYRRERCDCLIAFGGGSSIDCAKALGARIAHPRRSMNSLKGDLRVFRRLPTLIAIPTTAGTGSEVTVTAVITDTKKHHKYTMNSFPLIPHYAVLDPEVTRTLPPHLTATTGMDALTHAVEAYIGRSTSKETRRLSCEVVKLIFKNVERAYRDGDDLEARRNMLTAAYKAGIAFSKSYVGYVHAVAHSLGGQYNVPHGLANSVMLPIFLEAYGEVIHKKLHELAVAGGIAYENEDHAVAANRFIQTIRDMNRRMGIPEHISGIKKADIPAMAKHADREGNPLYPVPVLMDAGELERFYHIVSEGSNDK